MGPFSLSQLFSSSSEKDIPAVQSFIFVPSFSDRIVTILCREQWQGPPIPVFGYAVVKSPKKALHLFRVIGWDAQRIPIGDAAFHMLSSTIELRLHAQRLQMRTSSLSDSYGFVDARFGRLKWKPSGSASALELRDEAGSKLAQYQASSSVLKNTGAELKILVNCDDVLLDLIVLSVLVAAKMHEKQSKEDEAVSEIVQAVAGV